MPRRQRQNLKFTGPLVGFILRQEEDEKKRQELKDKVDALLEQQEAKPDEPTKE